MLAFLFSPYDGETALTPLQYLTYVLYHNNLTLYFHHFNSTKICFFRVFTEIVICNCGFLDIAGVIAIRLEMKCLVWKLTADAESGFLVKVWTMVIFTPVFVNLLFSNSSRLPLTVSERKIGKPKKKYT